jgi:protein ImuA
LRARIQALEGRCAHPPRLLAPQSPSDALAWTLGAAAIDRRLAGGLAPAALHEIKPEGPNAATGAATGAAAGWAAALGFALRLARRRLDALGARSDEPAPILWCWPSAIAREQGLPYGPGLASLGLEPSAFLCVETARAADALWAMEEGLKSQSLALVIGVLDEVALTPARRLSLAAAEQRAPCVLITDARSAATGSTATRWRVGARASAPHPFDPLAPGAPRYAVALERCRHGADQNWTEPALSLLLEWSDETHRFRVAPAVAHRADAPRAPRRSTA